MSRRLHRKTVDICNAILAELNSSETKTKVASELIPVIELFFPDWNVSERAKQTKLYRYINMIRENGIDLRTIGHSYVLYDTRTIIEGTLKPSLANEAFSIIGRKMLPCLSDLPLTESVLEELELRLFSIQPFYKEEIIKTILHGFIDKKCVLVEFDTRIEEDPKKPGSSFIIDGRSFIIEPHGLLFYKKTWIIAAREDGHSEGTAIRLSSIDHAYIIDKSFTVDPGIINKAFENYK